MLPEGVKKVQQSAELVYGPGRLIDPARLAHIFISPRQRAQQTWRIFADTKRAAESAAQIPTSTTDDLAEWDYGLYEGKLTHEIRALRQAHGMDQERAWDIWRDGCEGGETPEQVTARLDKLITKIKNMHRPHMHGQTNCDVVLVAHGHILRAFVKRWLDYELAFPLSMMLEPGGVGGLSYQHHNIEEPACLVGMSFPHSGSE